MLNKKKRNRELTQLYIVVGLAVCILAISQIYQILSAQVRLGIDAPSRWALLAIGLTNVLAIGVLLFIVTRNLVKLYFERRSGVLGSMIRTRLVMALFLVGIGPSLMLFLIGRTFIRKNVDRWFLPNTQQVIKNGRLVTDAFQEHMQASLKLTISYVAQSSLADINNIRNELDLDLLAKLTPSKNNMLSLSTNVRPPVIDHLLNGSSIQILEYGTWYLEVRPHNDKNTRLVIGKFVSKPVSDAMIHLKCSYKESSQISTGRELLETLPQNTFLFLTLLTMVIAVWIGLTIASTISVPVRNLARAAKRVGQGDLEVLLPECGKDELAMLSRSFNTMTRDLLHSRQAIEAQSERLEYHRAYLNQLLEALPVGILSWQEDGTLYTFNSVARHWLGVDEDNVNNIGAAWEQLSQQSRSGRLPYLLAQVRKVGQPILEELRIGWEGDGRLIRAAVIPLTGGGELAVLEDLSLLAQAERRAAWQEVARRMAHEVRNPLTPIQLTTQRLLRRSQEGRLDVDSMEKGAKTILAEVASLVRLVDSFSRFAKLPLSQPKKFDAVDLVQQTMNMFVPTHTNVIWQLDLPADPIEVFWDWDMIKRAIINMVDNAIGAMESRDTDQPSIGHIRVALRSDDHTVYLEVDDDGPGVPEGNRPFLFDPYFSTKQKGTGLGLAIVQRIADDHDGEVYYQPLNPGSRFGIKLPLCINKI